MDVYRLDGMIDGVGIEDYSRARKEWDAERKGEGREDRQAADNA